MQEAFSSGLARYIAEGYAPNEEMRSVFQRLLDAMKASISRLSQSGMLTDEQRALYDIILGGDERITENRPTPEAFEEIMLNEDVESDSDDDYSPRESRAWL